MLLRPQIVFFFFFNDTATTEIYTLSLHDALPISASRAASTDPAMAGLSRTGCSRLRHSFAQLRPCQKTVRRSEEHTSELQSRLHLVCRLLLGKKKRIYTIPYLVMSSSML